MFFFSLQSTGSLNFRAFAGTIISASAKMNLIRIRDKNDISNQKGQQLIGYLPGT